MASRKAYQFINSYFNLFLDQNLSKHVGIMFGFEVSALQQKLKMRQLMATGCDGFMNLKLLRFCSAALSQPTTMGRKAHG